MVDPKPTAKFVAFQSYYDIKQMPLGPRAGIELPYVEGLRLDEAMNPLMLLTFGMYGDTLPNQDGAPVRTVIPWKYGFKSIKSIVKIRFTKDMPPTTWNIANAHEYGFYSNVNPQVDHPRWSQASERRLDGSFAAHRHAVAQAADFPGVSRAAGAPRLAGLPQRVRRQPHRIHHAFHGNLDADRSVRSPDDDAVEADPEAELAHSLAAHVWVIRLFLRQPAFHDFRLAR